MVIRFGAHRFTLTHVQEPAGNEGGSGWDGAFIPPRKAIEIATRLTAYPSRELEVILHELVHLVQHEISVKRSERDASEISFGLAEVIARNPELWKHIEKLVHKLHRLDQ